MLRRAVCHHLAAVRALFWISSALIVWTQALYAPALYVLRRLKGMPPVAPTGAFEPSVSLVIAAYNEESVITRVTVGSNTPVAPTGGMPFRRRSAYSAGAYSACVQTIRVAEIQNSAHKAARMVAGARQSPSC